jgi:hypothetical protein
MMSTLFMEQAKNVIFQPAPQTKDTENGGGDTVFGGVSLNLRRDEAHVNLHYSEAINNRYNQPTTIGGTLEGFFDAIKEDPDAEKKYFSTIFLDDWDRAITRLFKPIVNWPDPQTKWSGEPVSTLAVQVGYPNTEGELQWDGHAFQASNPADTQWVCKVSKKKASDVSNPPEGWTPDAAFIKRKILFSEPPDEIADPYSRIFVECNEVLLDPEPDGRLQNDLTIEVRADSVGTLAVGPITLDALLSGPEQTVEVSLQALGRTRDGQERALTKFTFVESDQDKSRFWKIYTGQPDFVPRWRYKVRVIIKGTLFKPGQEWSGDWIETAGNGPIVIRTPAPPSAAPTPGPGEPVAAPQGAQPVVQG